MKKLFPVRNPRRTATAFNGLCTQSLFRKSVWLCGFLTTLVNTAATVAFSQAATPKLIPFQGRLTDQSGVAVSNGVRLVQFKIYDVPSGGSPIWAGEIHRTTINGGLVNV